MFDLTNKIGFATAGRHDLGRTLMHGPTGPGAKIVGVARSADGLSETFSSLGRDSRYIVGDRTKNALCEQLDGISNVMNSADTSSSGLDDQILYAGDMYGQAKHVLMSSPRRQKNSAEPRMTLSERECFSPAWACGPNLAPTRAFDSVEPGPASVFVGISELLHPDLLSEVGATACGGG